MSPLGHPPLDLACRELVAEPLAEGLLAAPRSWCCLDALALRQGDPAGKVATSECPKGGHHGGPTMLGSQALHVWA